MSTTRLVSLVIVAAIASTLVLYLIPRSRHSPLLDRILWGATWLVSAIGGVLGFGIAESLAVTRPLAVVQIGDVPILALLLGTFGGALTLIFPLWLMDHFSEDAPFSVTDEEPQSEPESNESV